jgi:hypothetical protein
MDEERVTWNDQPAVSAADTIPLAQSQDSGEDYELDITKYVQNLVDGTWDNYGMMLMLQDENTTGSLEFASSDYTYDTTKVPKITISYYIPMTVKLTTWPSKDAYIESHFSYDTRNFGTEPTFVCKGYLNGVDSARSVMRFDLSAVPPTAIVDSAFITLYGIDHAGDNASYLRRILDSWDEESVTWTNKPAETTSGQISLPASSSSTENYIIDVTGFVTNWCNKTWDNYGMMLVPQSETTLNKLIFASSDYEDTTMHPKLEIYYTVQPLDAPYDTSSENGLASVSLKSCGGVPPYSYQWSNGATTKSLSGLSYGNYMVTITDAWGNFTVRNIGLSKAGTATGSGGTESYNWVEEKTYNYTKSGETITQHTTAEGRVYTDYLNRRVQTVAKIESATDKCWQNRPFTMCMAGLCCKPCRLPHNKVHSTLWKGLLQTLQIRNTAIPILINPVQLAVR